MQTLILVGLLSILMPVAWSNCLIPPTPSSEKLQVLETWKARHVSDGILDGCLLKAKLNNQVEIYGYTFYGFICDLKTNESVEITRQTACCDTGENGDFACGVKTVNPTTTVPQVSITLAPARPDKRAIPYLINALEKADLFAQNITNKLLTYWTVSELRPLILNYLPRLKTLYHQTKSADVKAGMAQLLREIDPALVSELELSLDVLKVRFLLDQSKVHKAIATLGQHPEAHESAIPLLINFLHHAFEPKDRQAGINALMKFSAHNQPYLSQIYNVVKDDQENWKKLVCATVPLTEGALNSRVVWGGYEKMPTVACP